MHSASVVLPEPEPPSTAACRLSTSLLRVMLRLDRSARPARMLLAPSPTSSSRTESGRSSFGSAAAAALSQPVQSAPRGPAAAAPRGIASALPTARRLGTGGRRPHVVAEQVEPQQLRQRGDGGQQPGALEPVGKARIVPVLGVKLAHHHHALPVGDRHQDGAPALLAELAEGLRRLVLLVGREVARAQHERRSCRPSGQARGRSGASGPRPAPCGCTGRCGPRS